MTTLAANTPARNRNRFATVHARLRALNITNESEQRNIYAAITGKRSLRAMTNGERRNLEQWLYKQINAAPKPAAPTSNRVVSDEEAQSWLD